MQARTLLLAGCTLTTMLGGRAAAQEPAAARSPLVISSATVTIEGTSQRAPFFASTKTVRVTRLQLAEPRSEDVLEQVLRPGGLTAFEVRIPVMTLTSPDEGVDEHIHDALHAGTHPEIRFQLRSIEDRADSPIAGFTRVSANGTLTVAGIGRHTTLNIKALRAGSSLMLDGGADVLMTDFGVTPPKGLFGLLKTHPLIHVRFYLTVTTADE